MAKKPVEPAVKITRKCMACGEVFVAGHPNSPHLLCRKCENALSEMIREKRSERK